MRRRTSRLLCERAPGPWWSLFHRCASRPADSACRSPAPCMNCISSTDRRWHGRPHADKTYSVLCITVSLRWAHQGSHRTRASPAQPWRRGAMLLHCGRPAVTRVHDSVCTHLLAVGARLVRQRAVLFMAAPALRPVSVRECSSLPQPLSPFASAWAILCDAILPGSLPLSGARRSGLCVGWDAGWCES